MHSMKGRTHQRTSMGLIRIPRLKNGVHQLCRSSSYTVKGQVHKINNDQNNRQVNYLAPYPSIFKIKYLSLRMTSSQYVFSIGLNYKGKKYFCWKIKANDAVLLIMTFGYRLHVICFMGMANKNESKSKEIVLVGLCVCVCITNRYK